MAASTPFKSAVSSLSRTNTLRPFVCPPCLRAQQQIPLQARSLHRHVRAAPVPKPTPFVPDVSTFFKLIGRNLSVHASKFTSWESLFKLSSPQLKELGIEPPRTRRYLLRWREKFRKGEYGIGGDFKYVSEDGTGVLKVVDIPALPTEGQTENGGTASIASTSQTPGMIKLVVNIPKESETYVLEAKQTTKDLKKPSFVTLKDGHSIVGSYLQPVKGTNGSTATLKPTEGMWEDKRGRKIHGGERRRAETLHKLRVAERKKNER